MIKDVTIKEYVKSLKSHVKAGRDAEARITYEKIKQLFPTLTLDAQEYYEKKVKKILYPNKPRPHEGTRKPHKVILWVLGIIITLAIIALFILLGLPGSIKNVPDTLQNGFPLIDLEYTFTSPEHGITVPINIKITKTLEGYKLIADVKNVTYEDLLYAKEQLESLTGETFFLE